MRGFLTFFSFVAAAIYMLLALTHTDTPDGKKEALYAVGTQPDHQLVRRLNSWGPYLPSLSLSQEQQAPLAEQRAPLPREHGLYGSSQKLEQRLGAYHQLTASADEARISSGDLAERDLNAPSKVALTEPPPTKPALAKPKKGSRSAKPAVRKRFVVAPPSDPRSARWAGRTEQRRRLGLFMFGPVPAR
jgi:hypothetical protein